MTLPLPLLLLPLPLPLLLLPFPLLLPLLLSFPFLVFLRGGSPRRPPEGREKHQQRRCSRPCEPRPSLPSWPSAPRPSSSAGRRASCYCPSRPPPREQQQKKPNCPSSSSLFLLLLLHLHLPSSPQRPHPPLRPAKPPWAREVRPPSSRTVPSHSRSRFSPRNAPRPPCLPEKKTRRRRLLRALRRFVG